MPVTTQLSKRHPHGLIARSGDWVSLCHPRSRLSSLPARAKSLTTEGIP